MLWIFNNQESIRVFSAEIKKKNLKITASLSLVLQDPISAVLVITDVKMLGFGSKQPRKNS